MVSERAVIARITARAMSVVVLAVSFMNAARGQSGPTGIRYRLIDPTKMPSYGAGVDEDGDVVGTLLPQEEPIRHGVQSRQPFCWSRGTLTLLGKSTPTLSLAGNSAVAVANGPIIVGVGNIIQSGRLLGVKAWIYKHGHLTIVESGEKAGYFGAHSINSSAMIAGYASRKQQPCVYRRGRLERLPTLGAAGEGKAYCVNNSGNIVGFATNRVDGVEAAVMWRGAAQPVRLGVLVLGGSSIAFSVNDSDVAVGCASAANGIWHACLFKTAKCIDLGAPDGKSSVALCINSKGVIVGKLRVSPSVTHAFIIRNDKMVDLNDCIDKRSEWLLESARSINNSGVIVGDGRYRGEERAFILMPM